MRLKYSTWINADFFQHRDTRSLGLSLQFPDSRRHIARCYNVRLASYASLDDGRVMYKGYEGDYNVMCCYVLF